MFAYIWLLIVLEYISPGEIEFWEAVVTLAYFPLLVSSAYYTDQLSAKKRKRKRSTTYRDHQRVSNRVQTYKFQKRKSVYDFSGI